MKRFFVFFIAIFISKFWAPCVAASLENVMQEHVTYRAQAEQALREAQAHRVQLQEQLQHQAREQQLASSLARVDKELAQQRLEAAMQAREAAQRKAQQRKEEQRRVGAEAQRLREEALEARFGAEIGTLRARLEAEQLRRITEKEFEDRIQGLLIQRGIDIEQFAARSNEYERAIGQLEGERGRLQLELERGNFEHEREIDAMNRVIRRLEGENAELQRQLADALRPAFSPSSVGMSAEEESVAGEVIGTGGPAGGGPDCVSNPNLPECKKKLNAIIKFFRKRGFAKKTIVGTLLLALGGAVIGVLAEFLDEYFDDEKKKDGKKDEGSGADIDINVDIGGTTLTSSPAPSPTPELPQPSKSELPPSVQIYLQNIAQAEAAAKAEADSAVPKSEDIEYGVEEWWDEVEPTTQSHSSESSWGF